jgi:hypothetical protein
VQRALPSSGFQSGRVLNDEEGGGIEPHEGGESGEREEEGKSAARRFFGDFKRVRGVGEPEGCGKEAQEACDRGLGLRRCCEERREVAEEVANAGAGANGEKRVAVAGPFAEIGDEGDGEEAERSADEKCCGECVRESEGEQGEECCGG